MKRLIKMLVAVNFRSHYLLTELKKLTEHLKLNKKDENTRRGLMKLVGKRKRLLSYVKRKSNDNYESLIKSLGLRR